ncbi:hypothetical protein JXR93_14225 [bacterium]|nr:hypothetical protein [bacterium]
MDFTKDDQEILGELINIAFGSAVVQIADLFDRFAKLHVPSIELISPQKLGVYFEGKIDQEGYTYLTTQRFNGNFCGETLFFVNENSARNILNLVYEASELDSIDVDSSEIKESLLEIANILGASCVGKLSELLESAVTFAAPKINEKTSILSILKTLAESSYDSVIFVKTILEFEDEQISGDLFILSRSDSIEWLRDALNSFMESYS